jgi:cytochrome c oxidase assembly protein subunit 15
MVFHKLIYAKCRSTICYTKRTFVRLAMAKLPSSKIVGFWLLGCSGVVYGTVAVGGLTRLTESGLSMVKWDLIKTMKPPISQKDWEMEFEIYKKYPEYKHKLAAQEEITIDQFKFIWTMEYVHRMWGRAVGLIFLVPCTYFWLRGYFSTKITRRMFLAGSLIIAQGLIGWWMVKSGLHQTTDISDESFVPRVSQYRLVVHLSLAFVLYGVLLWNGLSFLLSPFDHSKLHAIGRLRGLVHGSKFSIFSTVLLGAFVAGLDAGLVYNSWPTYEGKWIPHELLAGHIGINEFFSNPVSVQFLHRNMAYLTLFVVALTWIKGRKMALGSRAKFALHALLAACFMQAALGIGTLVYQIPISLASIHQNGALILYSTVIWLANEIRRIPK